MKPSQLSWMYMEQKRTAQTAKKPQKPAEETGRSLLARALMRLAELEKNASGQK